ncbi:MAG TPA: hypothetical protein VH744_03640 [Terriglobales bacterium]|jgi:glycogen operon protein
MLLAGDPMSRTQNGNNNAYCQDNELSWLHWSLKPEDYELVDFVQTLIRIRRQHPVFHRRRFFQGRPIKGGGIKDLLWLNAEGTEMTDEEWSKSSQVLGMMLAGAGLDEYDARGRRLTDDNFVLLLNSHHEDMSFILPPLDPRSRWAPVLDTARIAGRSGNEGFQGATPYLLLARSLALLKERKADRRKAAEKKNEAQP